MYIYIYMSMVWYGMVRSAWHGLDWIGLDSICGWMDSCMHACMDVWMYEM